MSSRRLAQKLEEDVAFRALAAGNRPQHRTLCEFRRRHRADFGTVLAAVVQLAQDLGLVTLATLVPDSTKVRAHASQRKAMSYERLQQEEARLSAEIEVLQRQAEALDTAEDAQFGMDLRGDEVPAALQQRESRRAAIRKAQAALEARAQSESPAAARPTACGPMPATARNGTCRSWKSGALTPMWRWAGRGTPPLDAAPGDPPPGACSANWTRPRGMTPTPNASGWWKRPSVGLSAFWAFANSGCAAWAPCKESGIWYVWP